MGAPVPSRSLCAKTDNTHRRKHIHANTQTQPRILMHATRGRFVSSHHRLLVSFCSYCKPQQTRHVLVNVCSSDFAGMCSRRHGYIRCFRARGNWSSGAELCYLHHLRSQAATAAGNHTTSTTALTTLCMSGLQFLMACAFTKCVSRCRFVALVMQELNELF